jgi:hypothetical protein
MFRHVATLLLFSLALLASACSNESAFEPAQPTVTQDDQLRPSLNTSKGDDPTPQKTPGGSKGGWRK